MNAKEYLESKGIFGLDTKRRYNEVLEWMEGYLETVTKNYSIPIVSNSFPSREWLIGVINAVVDEHQTLGADNIADGIIEQWKKITDNFSDTSSSGFISK